LWNWCTGILKRPRENDEEIRHPADETQWKKFDLHYPEFSAERRNTKFALNTKLIILTMCNIPTWLCHKRKYLMLSILIQGPKQAGINIDVFLEPLTEYTAQL
jgi:hypothetical protein